MDFALAIGHESVLWYYIYYHISGSRAARCIQDVFFISCLLFHYGCRNVVLSQISAKVGKRSFYFFLILYKILYCTFFYFFGEL